MAVGVHLFPFRTEKLSPPAAMVLVPQGIGRVARRQRKILKKLSAFLTNRLFPYFYLFRVLQKQVARWVLILLNLKL